MLKKSLLLILTSCQILANAAPLFGETQKILPLLTNNKGKYSYYYHGESIKQALIMYAKHAPLQINFSQSLSADILKKTVSGQFSSPDNTGLLNTLSKEYGFEWFIYSGTLYITSIKSTSKSIEVAPEDMPMVKSNLKELGLYNQKFGYSELPAENRIIISGPEQYTNMMIEQIKSLNIAPTSEQFAVYPLKYANSDDMQLTFNAQQITIPGVATILQTVLNGNSQGANNSKNHVAADTVNPTKNQASPDIDLSSANNSSSSQSATGTITTPFIQADRRLNAVVIRDKATNLIAYKHLIEKLDVPTPLIQVDVLIVRLDQDALSKQGINWWATGNNTGYGFGAANLKSNPGSNLSFVYGAINPSSLLVTNVNSFLMSLEFLEQKNMAQAMGKPSVATIDNIPATVTVTQSLMAAAAPTNNANGGSSTSQGSASQINTSLQITPHVIFGKDNQRQIKLSIVLQDGSLTDSANSSTIGTLQGNITSQAVLSEGQSILLAGYTKDVSQTETTSIPYLGSIPLIGWFFKNEAVKKHKLTTLYLVSPKIIWMDNMSSPTESVTINNNKIDTRSNVKINDKKIK